MQGLMWSSCLWVLPYSHLIGFFFGMATPSGPRPPHFQGFTITLRHTTFNRTPLDEWWAHCRDIYLTTHTPLPGDRHPCPQWNSNPNPIKRAAAEPCFRLYGYWHQLTCYSIHRNFTCDAFCIPFNSTAVVRWLDMYKFHNFIDCTIIIHNSLHVLLCSACSQQ
jgi:hypothetical protein